MMIMSCLNNKTVLITGGVGLLGKSFTLECAKHEANVVVMDIEKKRGNAIIEEIKKNTGNEALLFQYGDITIKKDIEQVIDAALNKFGKIDCLVNNAYPKNKNYGRKLEDVSYEDFCENLCMHLGGYFLTTKEVSKVMIKQNQGNIINMASIYGFSAPKFELYEGTEMTLPVEYAAIKGGVINLTKYFASYLGKQNIRVNSLSPGGVFDNQNKKFVKKYSEKVLLGRRMANTEDITGTLIFLLSDDSKYITGQNFVVDGGITL